MTAAELVGPVAFVEAEFETLIAPETYTSKRTGQPAVAHNIAIFIEGQGSGRVYVNQDLYNRVRALGLKKGDSVLVGVTLRVFRGDASAQVVAFERA